MGSAEGETIIKSRIFHSLNHTGPHTTPLSIIDNSVAGFSSASAVWYFESPVTSGSSSPYSNQSLQQSLARTLDRYPQWCGSLRWTSPPFNLTDHTQRQGRLSLVYGDPTDPGVELALASSSKSLIDLLIPGTAEGNIDQMYWDVTELPSLDFVSSTQLKINASTEATYSPCMSIQITTLACRSIVIGIKIIHVLADAQALSCFMHDWASISRALLSPSSTPVSLCPVFDPAILDRAAAGNIDGVQPDADIVAMARALPMHRFDWFAAASESSPAPRPIPEGVDPKSITSPGTPIPWAEWDTKAPCAYYIFHFSRSECEGMLAAACFTEIPSSFMDYKSKVSMHDAILAHIWCLINRARGLSTDPVLVHLDISVGLRPRLDPPLPESFLGSPMIMADVAIPANVGSDGERVVEIAGKIRKTLASFGDPQIRAHLHDTAYEPCAQRLWQGFLGRRHILLTSWIKLGLGDVDFGAGKPIFVDPVMAPLDGIVVITEAIGAQQSKKHWSDDGINVCVHLEKEALARLSRDPLLRRYRAA